MTLADRDVFLSYRHREPTATWVRDVLKPALEQADFSVLLDTHDFLPGQVLMEEITRSAARARVTVAAVDELYGESWYTEYEAAISGTLVVVQRGDVEHLPVAANVVDLRNDDDPTKVVDEIDKLIKRAFVLESEADREFVTGYLLPALRQANVDAKDVDALAGAVDSRQPAFKTLQNAIDWADWVIVVVSRAYLNDLGNEEGRYLDEFEKSRRISKSIPLLLDNPSDPTNPFDIPPQYDVRIRVDMFDRDLWYEALQKICRAFDVRPPRLDAPPPCPYPGMRPYRDDERYLFVGRDREIQLVTEQLRRRRTAAVISRSGSGKSSLVLAGVLPVIRASGLDGRPQCSIEVVRPTDDLGTALDRLDPAANPNHARLLVVDQLEQAFAVGSPSAPGSDETGESPSDAGAQFLNGIVERRKVDPELHIIVTVRSDFYAQLTDSPIWSLVELDLVHIAPLTGTALESAIRDPAGRLGVVVAEPLVVRLASETEGQPGLMPFLQEALRKLWGRQPWWYLSLPEKDWSSGEFGVREAISRQADDALKVISQRHPHDGVRIARAILMRLVHFGENELNTRRQVAVAKIIDDSPDPPAYRDVFDILSDEDQRIVTVDDHTIVVDDETRHVQVADLSHDAIIAGWPTFQKWVSQYRDLEMERRTWDSRVGSEPLTGRDLAAAEGWLEKAQRSQFDVEQSLLRYITTSRAKADRKRLWERIVLVAAIAVAVLTTVLGAYAWHARNDAKVAQRTAEAETDRRVATQLQTSAAAYSGGLGLQALLVRAADLIDETDLGAIEMLVTVERDPGIARRIDATARNVGFEAAALLDDGRVVIGDGLGGLFVWGPGDSEPIAETNVGHSILTIAGQAGTSVIAVGGGNVEPEGRDFIGSDGWIDVVDASDPSLTSRRVRLDGDSPVSVALFDGDRLIVGTWDGTVALIDVSNATSPAIERTFSVPDGSAVPDCAIEADDRKVRSLAIDDERRWLVAGTNHCTIAVWDRATLEPAHTLIAHTSKVRSVAFVPGTSELLSTGDDSTVRSWDLVDENPTAVTLVDAADERTAGSPNVLEGRVVTMCVSPDGSGIVTAGRDHLVRRWSRRDGHLVEPVEFASHIVTVRSVICPTANTFVSVAGDGLVVWDLDRPNRWAEPIARDGGDRGVGDVSVRPDGSGQIAVTTSGSLQVVDADGTTHHVEPSEHTGDVDVVSYGVDGQELAAIARGVSGWADEVVVYDAVSLTPITTYASSGAGELTALSIADGANLAAGMNTGEILVVRDRRMTTLEIPTGRRVTAIALSTDGHLIVGDEGGTLLCARLGSTVEFSSIELGRSVNDIAVATDGTVAVGTSDGEILAYPRVLPNESGNGCDPNLWKVASPPVAHSSIRSVDLSDTGELLVAATSDGGVDIWDLTRLRLIGTLTMSANDPATSVSIDPEAREIAVGGESSAMRFRVDRVGLRERLCKIAARNLTADEEAAFLPAERYREIARCFE